MCHHLLGATVASCASSLWSNEMWLVRAALLPNCWPWSSTGMSLVFLKVCKCVRLLSSGSSHWVSLGVLSQTTRKAGQVTWRSWTECSWNRSLGPSWGVPASTAMRGSVKGHNVGWASHLPRRFSERDSADRTPDTQGNECFSPEEWLWWVHHGLGCSRENKWSMASDCQAIITQHILFIIIIIIVILTFLHSPYYPVMLYLLFIGYRLLIVPPLEDRSSTSFAAVLSVINQSLEYLTTSCYKDQVVALIKVKLQRPSQHLIRSPGFCCNCAQFNFSKPPDLIC